MSSHAANACVSDASAFFKSAGISCTTPLEILFCDIDNLLLVPYEPIPVSGGNRRRRRLSYRTRPDRLGGQGNMAVSQESLSTTIRGSFAVNE